MPLEEITIPEFAGALPAPIVQLIEDAEERITEFQETTGEQACPKFEPAEYAD